MSVEQEDISLKDEDAEKVLGGRAVRQKSQTSLKSHPGYVPGDTGVVEPASSGMPGDDSGSTDDGC
jgi:hypothetical protein